MGHGTRVTRVTRNDKPGANLSLPLSLSPFATKCAVTPREEQGAEATTANDNRCQTYCPASLDYLRLPRAYEQRPGSLRQRENRGEIAWKAGWNEEGKETGRLGSWNNREREREGERGQREESERSYKQIHEEIHEGSKGISLLSSISLTFATLEFPGECK